MNDNVYMKYDSRLKDRARENRKSETEAEKYIWHNLLRSKKLEGYKFTRQKMIGFFIADFYCSELKLIIEIDGKIHDDRVDYDTERSIEINKLGIDVIRFTNEEVLNNLNLVKQNIIKFINSSHDKGRCPEDGGVSIKSILITGTSKGIGKYLLTNLKEENEIIGISRSKSEENGLKEFNIDLTNSEVFNNIVNYFEQNDKKIDALIVNAGVGHFGKYEEGDSEKYKEIININLLSPILMIKELEPYLSEKAKIIFIGSIISKKFMKHAAVYQASKFGLRGFAGALKNEMKGKAIHIINPRIVDTSFHDKAEIDIQMGNRETKLEDIYNSVQSIVDGNENRFEIDL